MKLTQPQMSCSCNRHWKNWLCTDSPPKKVLFLKVCHVTPVAFDIGLQLVLQYPKVGRGWNHQKVMEMLTFVFLSLTWLQSSSNSLSPPGGGVPLLPGR